MLLQRLKLTTTPSVQKLLYILWTEVQVDEICHIQEFRNNSHNHYCEQENQSRLMWPTGLGVDRAQKDKVVGEVGNRNCSNVLQEPCKFSTTKKRKEHQIQNQ